MVLGGTWGFTLCWLVLGVHFLLAVPPRTVRARSVPSVVCEENVL